MATLKVEKVFSNPSNVITEMCKININECEDGGFGMYNIKNLDIMGIDTYVQCYVSGEYEGSIYVRMFNTRNEEYEDFNLTDLEEPFQWGIAMKIADLWNMELNCSYN